MREEKKKFMNFYIYLIKNIYLLNLIITKFTTSIKKFKVI